MRQLLFEPAEAFLSAGVKTALSMPHSKMTAGTTWKTMIIAPKPMKKIVSKLISSAAFPAPAASACDTVISSATIVEDKVFMVISFPGAQLPATFLPVTLVRSVCNC
jgi:hypothetical protein